MRWRHVDLKAGIWTIPAGNTKAGRTHVVPLSRQAKQILESLPRGSKGDYVWSTKDGKQPINGFSRMKEQIDRITMAKRAAENIEENIPGWSPHDLRRAIRTFWGKNHVRMIVGEGLLSHAVSSSRTKLEEIYDRYDYADEKRAAIQSWADHLDTITE
jgi:integrase